ncbi:cupin domain-containing protein [Longirhabdus pacifica]|uniref:cupin domain-containing protein n=1 Tax=Longirhabdus pacifica TaxID=2305227 RepID=UPI001008BBD2|nr:cupin domain-containing protein [Longirhabdus pacifica]
MELKKHQIIPTNEQVWEKGIYDNTEMCYLWSDEETARRCFYLKMLPDSTIPLHDHPYREIAIVTEGEVRLNEDIMRAGDFLTAGLGESHDVYSEHGCIMFIYVDFDMTQFELRPKTD